MYEVRANDLSRTYAYAYAYAYAARLGSLEGVARSGTKAIYADYAAISNAAGVTPGLPLGLPGAAKTVQVQDGKLQVKNGTYLAEGAGGYMVLEAESMEAAVALAAKIPPEVRGAALVADAFKGRAHAALRATIDGEAGAVWVAGNQVRTAFLFTVEHGKIAGIELFMDPVHLAALDVKIES